MKNYNNYNVIANRKYKILDEAYADEEIIEDEEDNISEVEEYFEELANRPKKGAKKVTV